MRGRSLLAAALLLAPPAALAALAAGPAAADASVESHVVLALIDTGINPYHEEFRDAARTAHPADYISGYPRSAQALDLCLDAAAQPACGDLRGAVARDAATWGSVERTRADDGAAGALYHIPGTRIVGAVSVGAADDPYVAPTRILDDTGHGTATASLAAGATLGACPSCLLVIVEGPGDEALAWARAQPWIDVVSSSWGWQSNLGWPPPPFGAPNARTTRDMVEAGKTVIFSSGNGPGFDAVPDVTDLGEYLLPGESTYTSEYTGPDWVVTVGAIDPENGQPIAGTGRPVDIAAAGIDVRAASAFARSGRLDFAGTSAAAPIAAGVFGHALLEARRALRDSLEGPRTVLGQREVVAQGAPPATALAGPLRDGLLTRDELQRAVYQTAKPCPLDVAPTCAAARAEWPFPMRAWGWTLPTPPLAYPLLTGYGGVDEATRDAAVAALLGAPVAPRPEADLWARSDSLLRQRMWGFWEHGATWADLLP